MSVELVHDLKTPLAVILLETCVLAHRLGHDVSPDIARSLDRLARNAEYLDRVVHDLLDTSAIEAGQLVLRREEVEIAQLVEYVLERRPAAERSRIQFEATPVMASVDPLRMERVVENLLTNAFKFSPARSTITVRVAGGRSVSIAVTDAGPGVITDDMQRIFERHRRGTTNREGAGIGLYASQRIVEAHGGRILVSTVPSAGARFEVEIPLDEELDARDAFARLQRRRVLIVDDEPSQLDALADLLRLEGMLVSTAVNGTGALERLVAEPVDVVIADVQMPGISGLELHAVIRNRWPGLPVVLATAFPRDLPALAPLLAMPGTAYLGKPVDIAQLLATLGTLLTPPSAAGSIPGR